MYNWQYIVGVSKYYPLVYLYVPTTWKYVPLQYIGLSHHSSIRSIIIPLIIYQPKSVRMNG